VFVADTNSVEVSIGGGLAVFTSNGDLLVELVVQAEGPTSKSAKGFTLFEVHMSLGVVLRGAEQDLLGSGGSLGDVVSALEAGGEVVVAHSGVDLGGEVEAVTSVGVVEVEVDNGGVVGALAVEESTEGGLGLLVDVLEAGGGVDHHVGVQESLSSVDGLDTEVEVAGDGLALQFEDNGVAVDQSLNGGVVGQLAEWLGEAGEVGDNGLGG